MAPVRGNWDTTGRYTPRSVHVLPRLYIFCIGFTTENHTFTRRSETAREDPWATCWDKLVDNLRTSHPVSFCYSPFLSRLSFRFGACMFNRTIHLNL